MTQQIAAHFSGPTGVRKITANILEQAIKFSQYKGLPTRIDEKGNVQTITKGQLLSAFKRAAPYMGIDDQVVGFMDLLVGFSQEQDWIGYQRPIVWPSNDKLSLSIGKSLSTVKLRIRQAMELGLILEHASSNGKRYGFRSAQTRQIIQAYGFDLSPLATRYEEFAAIVEQGEARWKRRRETRSLATAHRRKLRELEDLAYHEDLLFDDELKEIIETADTIFNEIQSLDRRKASIGLDVDDLTDLVESYAATVNEASSWIITVLKTKGKTSHPSEDKSKQTVDNYNNITPKGSNNNHHNTTTNPLSLAKANYSSDVNMKGIARKRDKLTTIEDRKKILTENPDAASQNKDYLTQTDEDFSVTAEDCVLVSPRFRMLISSSDVRSTSWERLIAIAGPVKDMLGISNYAWNQALKVMSLPEAIACLAVIDAKRVDNEELDRVEANKLVRVANPGGCFVGMLDAKRNGELHISRSMWNLKALFAKA